MPPLVRSRWPHTLARLAAATLLVLVVLAVLAWFFGRPLVEKRIRDKLQALVAEQLNAKLEIGGLHYRWPYGVQVDAAALHSATPGEPSIKLVGFDRFDLQLAKLPIGRGPLVIARVNVDRPTLYLIETKEQGFIGLEHLFKDTGEKRSEGADKLSDVLRLRHVQLNDARIEYDDRTISKSVPFVWDRLNLSIDSEPRSGGLHFFQGGAGNGDTARIDAKGSIDFDTLLLKLDALNITAKVDPKLGRSPLPAGVQRVLNTLGVKGGGRATVTGTVPLSHTRDLDLGGDFTIDDAQGRLSPDGRPLSDLNVDGTLAMKGREVTVNAQRFSFRRGTVGVSALPATVKYHLDTDRWTVTPVTGAIAYVPPPGVDGVRNQRVTINVNATVTELNQRDEFEVNLAGTTVQLPDSIVSLTLAAIARYDDTGITIDGVRVGGLGDSVTFAGFVNDTVSSVAGEITVRGGNLQLFNKLLDPSTDKQLDGKFDGNLKFAATDTLDAVRGDGRIRVYDGAFAKVPVLGGIAEKLNVGKNAFIAHEMYGRFTLDEKKVLFQRFSVNTDVMSAVGQGDVYYDGGLDLSVYADGHWYDKPKDNAFYIPILSDIGRALAKGGEYTIGSVSRQFTHFTVRGDLAKPKVELSPAPALTETLERAFRSE